jgi:hypothetical protein
VGDFLPLSSGYRGWRLEAGGWRLEALLSFSEPGWVDKIPVPQQVAAHLGRLWVGTLQGV